jgi:hypothetical protein
MNYEPQASSQFAGGPIPFLNQLGTGNLTVGPRFKYQTGAQQPPWRKAEL